MKTDAEVIATALDLHANYIETGNVCLSANDAVERKQHSIIRALQPDQREYVARLRALVVAVLNRG